MNAIKEQSETLTVEKSIFFCVTEQIWTKPYVMKRHHSYETRSVILRGEILAIKDDYFQVKLHDNNGFERDGEEYVFHKGVLLSNQDYKDVDKLGKWDYSG